MPVKSTIALATSLSILNFVCVLGCGGAKTTAASPLSQPRESPQRASTRADSGPSSRAANSVQAVEPEVPTGPLKVLAGDPDDQALRQVRLVPSTCENLVEVRRQLIESRVRAMREALKQSFDNWREAQPGCWEMYREREQDSRRPRTYSRKSSEAAYAPAMPSVSGAVAKSDDVKKDARAVRSASGTNNQVAGVDEADIVKHDGRYVYFALNGALRIASINPPKLVSVVRLSGQVKELFVEGNRAVVYTATGGRGGQRCTYGYDCQFAGDGSSTTIHVYDVADHAAPKLVRQIGLSGSLMAARRIGHTVHTVVADADSPESAYATWPNDLPECGVLEATVKARLKRLGDDNEHTIRTSDPTAGMPTITERGEQKRLCENLARTPLADGNGFTSVVSFDLNREESAPVTATVQSRPGAVFVSEQALYLSVTHQRLAQQRGWYGFYSELNEVSDIHKFRLGERPETTRYVGSGAVPGHVLNQFAMDEWYGFLRIATTRGKVPDPRVESQVSILTETPSGNLIRTGAVEHLAPGEDIRAVRFDNDRGYVVTFKKTDPLFVLDLRRPHHPTVLGELKIPGFSTYMHRIDPNHLLSIGLDANDHGDFAFFDGVILQLFDVTNPTDPKLIHKEKIGTRGSSSEAITNHLAFNYFGERGLLAIPMTICEGGGDGTNGDELTFAGLLVYQVTVKDGFHRLGGVNHGTTGSNCGTWWSQANSAVKRSLFLDDWVWSIAMDRAKVQRLSKLGADEADLRLN
jgi:hypothetical protein